MDEMQNQRVLKLATKWGARVHGQPDTRSAALIEKARTQVLAEDAAVAAAAAAEPPAAEPPAAEPPAAEIASVPPPQPFTQPAAE